MEYQLIDLCNNYNISIFAHESVYIKHKHIEFANLH